MNSIDRIFKKRLIVNYLQKFSSQNINDFERKFKIIQNWKKACEIGNIRSTKETSIQGKFLDQIFGEILGYDTLVDGVEYNQIQEFNSVLDSSEADGALGFFTKDSKDVRVVIELKDANTSLDKKQNRSNHLTPVEQGFNYANKNGSKCGWVIVSNFIETRLYKSTSSLEYEVFDLMKMDNKDEFIRFYFFLCRANLICKAEKSFIDNLFIENEVIGINISNTFYRKYKEIRTNLYRSLKDYNRDKDDLILFTKSQKLMDRFIFICFCEKCGLLPKNIYKTLLDSAHKSFEFSEMKIWSQLKGLFASIDKGNPSMQINRYNGGLFKADEDLDTLIVKDNALESFEELSNYDFGSDLNVNILGQIFEQSISDVEQIKGEINGVLPESKGKQKADGIFYTPYYVTRYIVKKTVGRYLDDKKEQIKHDIFKKGSFIAEVIKPSTNKKNNIELKYWVNLVDIKESETEQEYLFRNAVMVLHREFWIQYEEVLKNIKILDPACGSGAFLNQCFDYLHEEMNYTLEMKQSYKEGQLSLFDIDKGILQNNLYGVDINAESVEITKLSLWLKTAKKNQTLATLDDNIKCGNSLIEDEAVASDLAFEWEMEFKDVIKNGGFDIIVGNPPYGATLKQDEKDYIASKYQTTEGGFDTYRTFFELGFNLLKEDGYLGYITPNTYFVLEKEAVKLRHYLFDNFTLLNVIELYNVFPTAVVEPAVSIYKKSAPLDNDLEVISIPRKVTLNSNFINDGIRSVFKQSVLKEKEGYVFNFRQTEKAKILRNKISGESEILDKYFHVTSGAKPYQVGKGIPKQTREIVNDKPFTGYIKEDEAWVPYMRGKTIEKYTNTWSGEYIKYGEWLAEPRLPEMFKHEKLFIRQTSDCPIVTYDIGNVSNDTLYSIYVKEDNCIIDLKYLLGILNSKMMKWYYQNENFLEVGKTMAQVKVIAVRRLPLMISISQEEIIKLVECLLNKCQLRFDNTKAFVNYLRAIYEIKTITEKLSNFYMLDYKAFIDELRKKKVKLTSSQQMDLLTLFEEKKAEIVELTKEINLVEKELDKLVYHIYDLSQEDINLIEG